MRGGIRIALIYAIVKKAEEKPLARIALYAIVIYSNKASYIYLYIC